MLRTYGSPPDKQEKAAQTELEQTEAPCLELPDGATPALYTTDAQFICAMRLAAAMFWYQRSEISMEKVAMIAGLHRADFMDAPAAAKIDTFAVDIGELRREIARG